MAVMTCVGSLIEVLIRHANRLTHATRGISISLVGTVDPAGEHLRLTITDGEGCAFGGMPTPSCIGPRCRC